MDLKTSQIVFSVLLLLMTLSPILMVMFFEKLGKRHSPFFKSRFQKDVENLIFRYARWYGKKTLKEGMEFRNLRIENGDLVSDVYDVILGHPVKLREDHVRRTRTCSYEKALIDLLKAIVEDMECKTPEELSLELERRGF